jgi:chromosomal replication initiator protein
VAPLKRVYTFVILLLEKAPAAHAAALQITKTRTLITPFLYTGGVGLGKTHLMQAVGNKIKKNHSKTKVALHSLRKVCW